VRRHSSPSAARERLTEMKRQVLKDINNDLRRGREGAKDDGMDTYDLASEERDREISFILTDREGEPMEADKSGVVADYQRPVAKIE